MDIAVDEFAVPGFQVLELLGRGHSGSVYRVRKKDSGSVHALKVGHPSPRHSFEEVAFKLEYYFHSRLRHPNIVAADHFAEIDESHRYYVMEYFDSISPADLYGNLGLQALGQVARGVCRALEYSHSQGILHGDIKPQNILISRTVSNEEIDVHLADFGLAQRFSNPSTSSIQGTLAYIAPEQFLGWQIDPRSDLYSLGITLLEAITGRLPFAGTNPREILRAQMESRPISVLEWSPHLDPGWATLIDSMTSRNRADRPPSASMALEQIDDLLGHQQSHRSSAVPNAAPVSPTLKMIGRQKEMDELQDLLGAGGGPRVVVIAGDDGVGKTRLAEEFAQKVSLDGGRVFRSDASAGDVGLNVLRRVWHEGELVDLTHLRDGLQEEDASLRTSARPGSPAGRARLEQLAASLLPPVDGPPEVRDWLLMFDSVEQADQDSLEFLQVLMQHVENSSALLCLVVRSEALSLFEGCVTKRICLAPFSPAEVREHLKALLGELTPTPDFQFLSLDEAQETFLVNWMCEHAGGRS
jgi:hypothetical protein